MWSQRNKVRAVWSKVPRPWVRTNVSQMCTSLTRFRASAAFCQAKYFSPAPTASLPARFHLLCFPCQLPQPVSHVSPCPRFTFAAPTFCSPYIPVCHLFLLSHVPSTTVAYLCGLGFLSRPQGARGRRAEPWQNPEGRAVARPSLTFLRGTPALINQSSTKTAIPGEPTEFARRQRWTWMLCSSKYSSQRSRQGRRGAWSNKVCTLAAILWVGRQRHPHLMASPFPRGKAGWPHCGVMREALSVKAWRAAGLAASRQWHLFIRM